MGAAEQLPQHFTYADYAKWPEDERWELMDGVAYAMAAPSRQHQKIVLKVGNQIDRHLEGKPCEVYPAPFDIRLPNHNEADDDVETTVQPDLAVICDKNKLDDKGLPLMFGMDEATTVGLFPELLIDWAFMQETAP